MTELTPMQRRLLRYIAAHIDRYGYQPSMREIAAKFSLASPAGVAAHVRRLEKKKVVRCVHAARSIEFDWKEYL